MCASASPLGAYTEVGSSERLEIVSALSVFPTGLPAPVYALQALHIAGIGLDSSDTVVLALLDASGSVTCSSVLSSSTHVVLTQNPSVAVDLEVSLASSIDSGGQYVVCIQFRGLGEFYSLGDSTRQRLSVVTTSDMYPLKFNFVATKTLTVVGAGLSTRDRFFAVPPGSASCSVASVSGLQVGTPSFSLFNVRITLAVSFSDGFGKAFTLCIAPGGEFDSASMFLVHGGSTVYAAQFLSFSPSVVPLVSSVQLEVVGVGLPPGVNSVGAMVCMMAHYLVCLCTVFMSFFFLHDL